MTNALAAHVETLRSRLTALRTTARTRTVADQAAARRVAGLRYWDGDCVS
jgi:hypothetical protein